MNLLGIEMVLLTLGITILTFIFFQTIGVVLNIITAIKNNVNWSWNINLTFIITTLGILLIIISQNL